MKVINRLVASKITTFLQLFPAVAVIGSRQCGKSTLVQSLLSDWKYYDLERPDDYQLISSDPLGFLKRQSTGVVIDEAQQFPALFPVLRSIIDEDRHATGRFVLTGSSSPDIIKGLSESLAGRIATVELSPFKMAEFYEQPLPGIYGLLIGSGKMKADVILEQLADLQTKITVSQMYQQWLLGGYPEPRVKGRDYPAFHGLWMDEYFADYIRRDIQRLFPRLNIHVFRRFIQSLSFCSGKIINQSSLARTLDVSSVSTKEYLDILHNTFIWRNLGSYEKNKLKTVQKMPKGFFRDTGILHHLLKLDDLDRLLVHPDAGSSFESFVIEEIIRGFQCTAQSGIDFNYYRTRDRSEIDLIIDAPFGIIPVEIKLGTRVKPKMLIALKNFIKDTDAKVGILINNSDKIEVIDNNIIQIPAVYV